MQQEAIPQLEKSKQSLTDNLQLMANTDKIVSFIMLNKNW